MTGRSAFFLDVNVLLALVWPAQENHDSVREWFLANASRKWATCPMTQAGCVRLLSNPAVTPGALSVGDAAQVVAANLRHPGHTFWPDDLSLFDSFSGCNARLQGYRQITDAYLLGLALHHNGCLATLDGGISSILPPDSPHRRALLLISPGVHRR